MRFARLPVLALVIALPLLPVPAAAHPLLVGASPPSGTSAAAPPARIVMSFTEALDPTGSSVVLVAPDGRTTPWVSTVSGGTLTLQPPALPAGAWRVRWAVAGSDGARETGDYRFIVATPASAGAATGRPGPVERAGRVVLLVLGVILAGLLLGGAVLPADPARRPPAGRRIAGLRSMVWGLTLLSLLGYIAGLAAAGGWSTVLASPAGPPLLAAAGVAVALGVAVFDGGALSSGEVASLPTRLLGSVLGAVLLAALVAVEEAPGGDAMSAIAGTLALSALAAVAGAATATLATAEGAAGRRAELGRLLPRTVVGLALLGAAAALRPDPVTGAAAVAGALVAAVELAGGGALGGRPRRRDAVPGPPARAITLPGRAEPHLARVAVAEPAPPPAPELSEPDPLPAGAPLHQGLSGHFVDLVRLLETLEWSAFTGYVRVEGAALGVLVLVAGELGAARVEGGQEATGEDAVRLLAGEVSHGEAMLDVVRLDTETARAIVDLLSAPPLFSGLGARMVNLDGVLEDLCERRRDGSVVVRAPDDTGVILVRGGGVHGAYTRSLPHLDGTPAAVAALAGSAGALVEVRVASPRPAVTSPPSSAFEGRRDSRAEPFWDRYCEARHVAGLD
jgi:methionine-rich copper-binding protein CopC